MRQNHPYGRADLHIHTTASDGLASVETVLDSVAQRGHLDVIAITDHDNLEASLWACDQRGRYPFDIIPGVEITSAEGHVLGLWITRPIPMGLSLAETAAAVHHQGGLAILAHPFHFHIGDVLRSFRRYLNEPEYLIHAGLDALEIHNAGILFPGCNILARRFARQLDLPVTGSSDAHTAGAIGSGRTRFPGRTADDLRHALTHNLTLAEGTPWPFLDYIEVVRALPNWQPPAKVPAHRPAEHDVEWVERFG